MENKYLNEAIIGNKDILATYTQKGELQRLYFPSKDNKQYINFFHTGVRVNKSDLIYLHDDINNNYKQYYDTDTNILNTEITNTYFNLITLQTDYIPLKENVLIGKLLPAGTGFRGPLKSPETLAKEAEEAKAAELAKYDLLDDNHENLGDQL